VHVTFYIHIFQSAIVFAKVAAKLNVYVTFYIHIFSEPSGTLKDAIGAGQGQGPAEYGTAKAYGSVRDPVQAAGHGYTVVVSDGCATRPYP